ncbi:sugar porter family MFS transporter [Lentilactobacillus hilgardii]|uniref:MFS transporter, SP family n=1 Tax=Lentilactobacillus hilgardii (strain ATCC 8290 / DSM 20176 / CCUG 30140 / JCM 1155 / KCTC 3500 / NBRC 15886 / NCIMB 8040 / NRRL B-1843 / 9) TaxID=1423757 RepID=C0XN22_LENH9|nr:sugar porter family MFS transporter [Lentilactobacillus hilgardii]EEI20156.1 MFS transporter, SP family [Lentilactobacillus buchneri ATCC 11577]EEI23224.1 MFS transporter, SP family [Lentilactobacillus hilgardii DSM 20176 = ATCC 8290]KRK53541.1 MFS family major facilitator transporter [Lentilactobacillus hilgardii DSM 20176 = ATCC 8290]MCP9333879.1 sugar porter family MFS transporter [Lentilactobacillus hilgardii]MCP9350463.1 sugar porter family MFS transporter [Lentilactobacillus hilgardii
MRARHLSIFFIFVFGALGGLLFGFDTGIISGASSLIENDFSLNIEQTGFITSSVLIGSSIGALSIGTLSDRFGRKRLLLVASILFLLGSGLSMTAVGFASMVTARIILGFAVGSASALTPAYLAELADAPHRGSLGTMFQLMITAGILLAYVSNLGFLHHNLLGIRDWRWMLGSALIPAAILFIGSLILPESPRYLVEKGNIDEARNVLHELRKNTNEDPDKELTAIQKIANQPKGGWKELVTFARPAVIVAIGLMLLQQLVGINSVIYFLPQVFIKGFGFAEGNAIWISVGIGIVNFLCTILAYQIMDKFNRRTILLFGSIVMAISIGILSVLNFTLTVQAAAVPTMILIAIYIFGFAVSWGPICWLMLGEIFPLNVRGVGNSIGSAANWIGNFIVSQFFLVLLNMFHNNVGGPFAVFTFFAILSIFFVIYMVPETRGKTLEDIEMEMRQKAALKKSAN